VPIEILLSPKNDLATDYSYYTTKNSSLRDKNWIAETENNIRGNPTDDASENEAE
tara:strand:+ start:2987 stop:3151 length:165 start_codon:yes stop_codon:yes gene_type:complete